MREVLDDDQTELFDLLHVGGSKVGDLKYADDVAMISKSRSGLKKYVTSLNERGKDYGMKINASKTKCYGSGKRGWKEC